MPPDTHGFMRTNQRYIVLTFLAFAVAVGFSVRGLAGPLLAWQELPDPRVFGVVDGSSLVGAIGGVAAFVTLLRSVGIVTFTDEVISELRKVTWPDRDETFRSTITVIATSLFLAMVLAGFDWLWGSLTSAFLFTEG